MLRSFSDLGNVASYTFLLLKRTALKRTGTFGSESKVMCDVSMFHYRHQFVSTFQNETEKS